MNASLAVEAPVCGTFGLLAGDGAGVAGLEVPGPGVGARIGLAVGVVGLDLEQPGVGARDWDAPGVTGLDRVPGVTGLDRVPGDFWRCPAGDVGRDTVRRNGDTAVASLSRRDRDGYKRELGSPNTWVELTSASVLRLDNTTSRGSLRLSAGVVGRDFEGVSAG